MPNITIDLQALSDEMDRLGREIENDKQALNDKMQRRNMLVEFLMLADKLVIEPQPLTLLPAEPPRVFVVGQQQPAPTVKAWPQTIHAGIHEVMREGGIWKPKGLSDEMVKRGWHSESTNPETIIATQLSRLSKDPASPIQRMDYGRYIYSAEPTEGVI